MQVETNDEAVKGIVAAHLHCNTSEAKYLCVLDPAWKLKIQGDYDIGGTYCNGPDFWFLYRTKSYLDNFLMSLFVCNRRAVSFNISCGTLKSISDKPKDESKEIGKFEMKFKDMPDHYDYNNLSCDTYSFIKTFRFSKDELVALENRDIYIEINIDADPYTLSPGIMEHIKLNHNFGRLLEQPDYSDLIIESSDGCKFPVHKVIISANCSVLMDMMEEPNVEYIKLSESSDEVKCLLKFLYTGSISSIKNVDGMKLMNMGIRYKLGGLKQLSQPLLLEQLCEENAFDILQIARNNCLSWLQEKVLEFMRKNPVVFSALIKD